MHYLHDYLDDFFTAGSPDSNECFNNLITMLSFCKHVIFPVKSSKIEGPSSCLLLLDIITNTTKMQATICILEDCKQDLLSSLLFFKSCYKCTKQLILSLIGKI